MSWAKLDDGFWMHPKVMIGGNEAAGIFARCLSYCGAYLTDGRIPDQVAIQIAGSDKKVNAVVDVGLLVRLPSGDLYVEDYADYNMLRDEVEHRREQRKQAGRNGGLAKARANGTHS